MRLKLHIQRETLCLIGHWNPCTLVLNRPPSFYKIYLHWQYKKLAIDDITSPLQWRHNERDGVSNHWHLRCLLKCWFRLRSKKHQSSASQAFVRGIHRWPVNSPHKRPVTRKMFPFDDVIMLSRTCQFVKYKYASQKNCHCHIKPSPIHQMWTFIWKMRL